jgi:hypothetical protein
MPCYRQLVRRSLYCRSFHVDFQAFELGSQRLILVDPEKAGGLGFDAIRFTHRTTQIMALDLVQQVFEFEIVSQRAIERVRGWKMEQRFTSGSI